MNLQGTPGHTKVIVIDPNNQRVDLDPALVASIGAGGGGTSTVPGPKGSTGESGPAGPTGPSGPTGAAGAAFAEIDGGVANSTYGGISPINGGNA